MSSGSSYISISISTPSTDSSADTPQCLPTPRPNQEPTNRWSSYHTGFTPENKKAKRSLFISPNTKEKIDEIHHYQKQQMDLQRELYFEQKVTARRLSFLKQVALKFCSSRKKDVHEPLPKPCSSLYPSSSYRTPSDPSPRRYSGSPRTHERRNIWSPLRPWKDNDSGNPKTSSPSK